MTIRIRGTKSECEERIKRQVLVEIRRTTVVYEDGLPVGVDVEVTL